MKTGPALSSWFGCMLVTWLVFYLGTDRGLTNREMAGAALFYSVTTLLGQQAWGTFKARRKTVVPAPAVPPGPAPVTAGPPKPPDALKGG